MSAKVRNKPSEIVGGVATGTFTKHYAAVRDATDPEKFAQADAINDGEIAGLFMNSGVAGDIAQVCSGGYFPGKAGDTSAVSGRIAVANAAGKIIGYAAGSTGVNAVGEIWSDAAAADELVTIRVAPTIR